MVKSCSAVGCSNKHLLGSGVTFHKFPSDPTLLSKWLQALKRLHPNTKQPWTPKKTDYICSEHFNSGDLRPSRHGTLRLLRKGAVPSIFSWKNCSENPPRSTLNSSNHVSETASTATTSSERLTKYVNMDHSYYCEPASLKRKYDTVLNELQTTKYELRNSKKREKRARHTLDVVLKELTYSKELNEKASDMLETYKEIPIDLFLKPATEYSNEQRQFATTLFFYGPRAYNFIREKLNLPHPSTIRRWLSNISSRPGYSEQVFNMLKEKVSEDADKYGHCSLMVDGMSIRKHLDWDPKYKEMVGFVDIGAGSVENSEEATEVIVIMAVGLQSHWKVPVGYFLVNGITADIQQQLIITTIDSLYKCHVTVVALVMDGHTTNQRMASLLGCSLDPSSLISKFVHPSNSETYIYLFFDVCHLLKNLRGALHAYGQFSTSFGTVKWLDIVKLQELQVAEGLHAANKLTLNHIKFQNKKMNVRLAAQTFSSSVAAALNYANNLNIRGFENASATANFVSMIDRLFDLFNSRSPVAKGYKGPLKASNFNFNKNFLLQTQDILMQMSDMTNKKICEGKRKISVIGFMLNINSLIGLCEDLLLSPSPVLKYLLTYKLSQDHLETFFAAVRQAGGWNNNPSALQFRAAYRSLLSHAGICINGSFNANCQPKLDNTNLLNVITCNENNEPSHILRFNDTLFDHGYSTISNGLSSFVEGIIEYISGWVVRKVVKKLSCIDCSFALIKSSVCQSSTSSQSLLVLKNNGGLVFPSDNVIKIINQCEIIIRSTINIKKVQPKQWEQLTTTKMLSELPNNCFPELNQHFIQIAKGIETHEYSLMKHLCHEFIRLRRYHTVKLTNVDLHGNSIRHSSNKKVLFMHQ